MTNSKATNVQLATPYTLDSLLANFRNLPDAIMPRYLEGCLKELKELTGKDVAPDSLQRISTDLIDLDLPLVGSLPWDMFVENVPWVKPYYKWAQCLAAGKNSEDCILPKEFIDWRDKLTAETDNAEKQVLICQAVDSSDHEHGFNEETAKILLRTLRNYRRYHNDWDQSWEELYRKTL